MTSKTNVTYNGRHQWSSWANPAASSTLNTKSSSTTGCNQPLSRKSGKSSKNIRSMRNKEGRYTDDIGEMEKDNNNNNNNNNSIEEYKFNDAEELAESLISPSLNSQIDEYTNGNSSDSSASFDSRSCNFSPLALSDTCSGSGTSGNSWVTQQTPQKQENEKAFYYGKKRNNNYYYNDFYNSNNHFNSNKKENCHDLHQGFRVGFFLDAKLVGGLIGKGGGTVQGIRDNTKAKISIGNEHWNYGRFQYRRCVVSRTEKINLAVKCMIERIGPEQREGSFYSIIIHLDINSDALNSIKKTFCDNNNEKVRFNPKITRFLSIEIEQGSVKCEAIKICGTRQGITNGAIAIIRSLSTHWRKNPQHCFFNDEDALNRSFNHHNNNNNNNNNNDNSGNQMNNVQPLCYTRKGLNPTTNVSNIITSTAAVPNNNNINNNNNDDNDNSKNMNKKNDNEDELRFVNNLLTQATNSYTETCMKNNLLLNGGAPIQATQNMMPFIVPMSQMNFFMAPQTGFNNFNVCGNINLNPLKGSSVMFANADNIHRVRIAVPKCQNINWSLLIQETNVSICIPENETCFGTDFLIQIAGSSAQVSAACQFIHRSLAN